ncbi:MAG: flavodoxin-dependent (E)-4-hydroxy-3-methylbut-2-enyl-diphosphate synthase [Spirochaetes bacterium]|nr:flavodoxin-dependent (E)-4-hydroxy-3-methylbut-2-enyl-diphosphate synthase [Spirochaetota bacterium]
MRIKVGNVIIGENYIPIQTMIKNSVRDVKTTIDKINKLANIGCDIIRISIPDSDSILSLKEVIGHSLIPIVADIHFDYRLAIMAAEAGVQKIRINPGNIGHESKVKKVIDCVKEYNIPVRIGINSGSLPTHLIKKYHNNSIKIMIESAKEEIRYFEKYGYDNIVLSFKSSNVLETISINRKAKKIFNFPIHIGVTEAGDFVDGAIKNTAGISILLMEGIGDTIRVSLTAKEEHEIIVGKKILESVGRRIPDIEIISCPTCGRTEADIEKIVAELKKRFIEIKLKQKIKIAVMGCVVNGPGEAKSADFGVACGRDKSIIFENGKKLKIIKNNAILDELLIMASRYYEN